jgi:hypothetical protein
VTAVLVTIWTSLRNAEQSLYGRGKLGVLLLIVRELGQEFAHEPRDAGIVTLGIASGPLRGLMVEGDVESLLRHGSSNAYDVRQIIRMTDPEVNGAERRKRMRSNEELKLSACRAEGMLPGRGAGRLAGTGWTGRSLTPER